jgi:hypothetical protein
MCQINAGSGNFTVGANSVFEVFYSSGIYYIVFSENVTSGNTGVVSIHTVPESSIGTLTTTNSTATTSRVYSQSTYTPKNDLAQHWPKITSGGEFVFMSVETSGSSYVYKRLNVVTRTFAPPFTIDVSTITPNSGTSYSVAPFRTISVADDTANKLNTTFYPQTATLRVTGVQTTP